MMPAVIKRLSHQQSSIFVFLAGTLMLGIYHPFIKTMNQFKLNEAHTHRTDPRPAPARKLENSEVSAKNTVKTSEVATTKTSQISKVATTKSPESSEVLAKKTAESTDVAATRTDKSSAVVAKNTAETFEMLPKKTAESSKVAAKKTDKASEALAKKTSKAEVSSINVVSNDSNRSKTPQQCYHDYLGPTQADDMAKIESYKFEGIEKYIKDLFSSNISTTQITDPQKYPTFVSGISSNHFKEGLVMLEELNKTVRTKYIEVDVIMFDLGLTQSELKQLNETGLCNIRTFRYELYPEHVKKLHNFAWKAIVIQTVAKETPFVIWVDASVRFRTGDLDGLIQKIRENGLVVAYLGKSSTGTVAERTHLKTFEFLDEKPCTFALHHETWATIIPLYANPFITKYFLYPFVACALTLGCMEPFPGCSDEFLNCPGNSKPNQYHLCHRSDQSTVGILFYRLFHLELEKHELDLNYIRFCRSTQRMCNGF